MNAGTKYKKKKKMKKKRRFVKRAREYRQRTTTTTRYEKKGYGYKDVNFTNFIREHTVDIFNGFRYISVWQCRCIASFNITLKSTHVSCIFLSRSPLPLIYTRHRHTQPKRHPNSVKLKRHFLRWCVCHKLMCKMI